MIAAKCTVSDAVIGKMITIDPSLYPNVASENTHVMLILLTLRYQVLSL